MPDQEGACNALSCLALAYECLRGKPVRVPFSDSLFEANYVEAISVWRLYAGRCLCNAEIANNNAVSQRCSSLASHVARKIAAFIGSRLDGAASETVVSDNLLEATRLLIDEVGRQLYSSGSPLCWAEPNPASTDYESAAKEIHEAIRSIYKSLRPHLRGVLGEYGVYKALHVMFPGLPLINDPVCRFFREDRSGQCSGLEGVYNAYIRVTRELSHVCSRREELRQLLSYQPFTKVLYQSLWLAQKLRQAESEGSHSFLDFLGECLSRLEGRHRCPGDLVGVLQDYTRSFL